MDTLSRNHIKQIIHKYKTSSGKYNTSAIINDKNFKLSILNCTDFLNENYSFTARIFCIMNDIYEVPRCNVTGKELKWNANKKCFNKSKEVAYKTRKTNTNKFKNKINTNKDKFYNNFITGNYNTLSIEECINFTKKICPHMYLKNKDVLCSILHYTQNIEKITRDDYMWGMRIYCLKNNITSYPLDRFGNKCKYIDSISGFSKFGNRDALTHSLYDEIKSNIENCGFELTESITSIPNDGYINIKCKKCNTIKQQFIKCGYSIKCYCHKCLKISPGRSNIELEICNYIKSISNYKVELNKKINNTEIDIYLPELKLGIELDGILWHSFGTSFPNNANIEKENKNKSLIKKIYFEQLGIELLIILDQEWFGSNDIVKSLIKAKLQLISNKIYARKCDIIKLDYNEKKTFFINNHIQGDCQSFVSYGLKYNNKIVCAISFTRRKLGKNNSNNIELARYCVSKDINVIGGFSKLLKYAQKEQKFDSVISYCDKRLSSGNVYFKNGFKLLHSTPQNYFYTKDSRVLESRLKYQKHKLKNIFNNVDESMTETEIMYLNGYRKWYDCGNYVFKKDFNFT